MSWILLFIAGLFEIGWALGLKYTEGFTRPGPTAAVVACLVLSIVLLGIAVRHIPIGTAYAVWTGIGVVGTVLGGILLFHESRDWVRLACLTLILLGIAGLKLRQPPATPPFSPPPPPSAVPPAA